MITPNITNRKVPCTAAIQAALDESELTGEPVHLRGTLVTDAPLYVRGANVVGYLGNHSGNWGNPSFTPLGNTAIYAKHGQTVFVCSTSAKTGRSPSIRDLAVVCFHSSANPSPGINPRLQPAIRCHGRRSALNLSNILIDAPGIGIELATTTCEHKWDGVTIRSPRTAGVRVEDNSTVVDCRFRDIHISGTQHNDYVPNAPDESRHRCPVGWDGLPASSVWHGRTLIEHCTTGIRTGTVLNQYLADCMIEVSQIGIEVGEAYPPPEYLRRLEFGRLHLQASLGFEAIPFTYGGKKTKTTVQVGSFVTSKTAQGKFLPSTVTPANVALITGLRTTG